MYWVLFFTLIGFGLRVQKLSFQPLWGDEGWSFYFATQATGQLLALTAVDIHPPLYYLLLKAWLAVAGIGPETARFLSVGVGTALIPAVGLLGRRLFARRVGVTAAALTAVMPMAIYYSQEVRMYGLVTLLGALSIYFLTKITGTRPQKSWQVAYVAATAAALYTHYYAAFIVLAQVLYVVWFYWRSQHSAAGRSIYAWLRPFVYAGLLYLPWVIYAGLRLVSYVENKRTVEGYAPLNIIRFFGDHFVAFSLGHLPAYAQAYNWAALLAVGVASLGFLAAIYTKNKLTLLPYLYLFVPLLVGYLINQVYPFTPRFYERTLLLAAPAYWLFVAAGLAWLWKRNDFLGGITAMALLLVVSVSLNGFYTVPRYPHQDYRPMLKDIAARATPQDTLLASYQWQIGFYQAYLPSPRPKLFTVPGWGQGWSAQAGNAHRLMADLTEIFEQSPRLWFPAYQAGGHIWEDEAEAAIARMGYPAWLRWYSPETKLTLAGATKTPLRHIEAANFENRLTLLGATVGGQQFEAGRDIVPVQLAWQKQSNLGSEHYVSLRLADAAGRTWATRDSQPRAGQAFFTDMNIGDTLADRHGLLTPAGAPPGTYRLLLSVRRASDAHPLDLLDSAGQPMGAELPLAEVTLVAPNPPVGAAALPVQTTTNATFGQQVRLIGYTLGHPPYKSGQALPLTLFWESLTGGPGPLTVLAELKDNAGHTVVSHRQEPIWPTGQWQPGTILRDPQDFTLPPTLAPGKYELVLSLLTPTQERLEVNGRRQLPLTRVTTVERPRVFEAPDPQIELNVLFGNKARLVGIDLPQAEVPAGQALPLTLYWQAAATFDKSWTVFVHLTNGQGQIISQQDQIPGGGQFPTTGWVPDEYLVDTYNLVIPAGASPGDGPYRLKIGLYDANDFTRLPVLEEGEIVSDHFTLESWPILVE